MNTQQAEVLKTLLWGLIRAPEVKLTELRDCLEEGVEAGDLQEYLKPFIAKLDDQRWKEAETELERAAKLNVQVIAFFDPEYPPELSTLRDKPLLLFVRGRVPQGERIAIVGTRKASPYGARIARSLAGELTDRNVPVVSGLARGIDTAAHQGALSVAEREAGTTAGIAVLGSGVMHIYPEQNKILVERMLEQGAAIISEYGLYTTPRQYFFPERNRIISGLSTAIAVIEAEDRSGALVTARLAAEQGREVFALPGTVDSPLSSGTHRLLKDGARVLTSVDDLLDTLRKQTFSSRPAVRAPRVGLRREPADPVQAAVLALIHQQNPTNFDEIVEASRLEPRYLSRILTQLALEGYVSSPISGLYIRD